MADEQRLSLIADVAASYLRQNSVRVDQIGSVVAAITKAVEGAATELAGEAVAGNGAGPSAAQAPAVPVKKSVQGEYIVCLEDGSRVRTLKRHLMSAHGMNPQDYRQKWNLPRDYPMTAPAYSAKRSEMAKKLGLGRKAGTKVAGRKRGARKKATAAA